MKITRTSSSGARLAIRRAEWERIGREKGWVPSAQGVEMRPCGDRAWSVYVDGELLGIVAYAEKALAPGGPLERLLGRIGEAGGRIRLRET